MSQYVVLNFDSLGTHCQLYDLKTGRRSSIISHKSLAIEIINDWCNFGFLTLSQVIDFEYRVLQSNLVPDLLDDSWAYIYAPPDKQSFQMKDPVFTVCNNKTHGVIQDAVSGVYFQFYCKAQARRMIAFLSEEQGYMQYGDRLRLEQEVENSCLSEEPPEMGLSKQKCWYFHGARTL